MKSLIKYIIPAVLMFVIFSCEDDDSLEIPTNSDTESEYTYVSASEYHKASGKVIKELESEGYLSFYDYYYEETNVLVITPVTGWSYSIVVSNFVDHELIDGSTVTTFTIGNQQEYLNEYTFSIIGTNGITLYDSDSTVIGEFDGYITDTKVYVDFKSTNLEDQTWVNTQIEATKKN